MSAAAPDAMPPPDVELTPRAIHDAVLPEEVGDVDRQYRQAMPEATESLDLTAVLKLLEHWRWIARSSQDPVAHRRMLATAAALDAGVDVPTVSSAELKARLGPVGVLGSGHRPEGVVDRVIHISAARIAQWRR